MPFPKLLLIPLALLLVEGGVQAWRRAGLDPSTAPVFSWDGAELLSPTAASGRFAVALNVYRADRGSQQVIELPGGRTMELTYLEWDDVETGPFAEMAGHEPEVCNAASGFKILQTGVPRECAAGDGKSFLFHYTAMESPTGKRVHVYKMPWVQGIGPWHIDSSRDRSLRLQRSFFRHRGAARVLQVGVSGTESEAEAWETFQREVLDRLEWH
jgi:hypothetical protein